jgi:hypothetical protein
LSLVSSQDEASVALAPLLRVGEQPVVIMPARSKPAADRKGGLASAVVIAFVDTSDAPSGR